MNVRALAAEAIGTFILLTFGFLAVATVTIVTEGAGGLLASVLVVPLSFGLGLMVAIAIGGHVSGGHFNPAVTLAALFDGRITRRRRSATWSPRSSAAWRPRSA